MIPRCANTPEVTAAFERVAAHLRDGIPTRDDLSELEMRCLKAIRLRQMEKRRFRGASARLQRLYDALPEAS